MALIDEIPAITDEVSLAADRVVIIEFTKRVTRTADSIAIVVITKRVAVAADSITIAAVAKRVILSADSIAIATVAKRITLTADGIIGTPSAKRIKSPRYEVSVPRIPLRKSSCGQLIIVCTEDTVCACCACRPNRIATPAEDISRGRVCESPTAEEVIKSANIVIIA